MATISKTVARANDVAGVRRRCVAQVTGPVLYAAGGFSLTPAEVGMGVIEFFDIEPLSNATPVILIAKYDYTNQKLQVFDMAGAESGAIDLSGYTARFEAAGR